jgi:hypothetical protein
MIENDLPSSDAYDSDHRHRRRSLLFLQDHWHNQMAQQTLALEMKLSAPFMNEIFMVSSSKSQLGLISQLM